MSDGTKRCLLCGDPQQPSAVMSEAATALKDVGVSVSEMEWESDLSAAAFRDITMDMESRGPNDFDPDELIRNIKDVQFLIVHKAPVSRDVIEAGNELEVVAAARGGTENIDIDAATEHNVTVLHAPGRNADAVADYAVSFGLAAHREIPQFARSTGSGEWNLTFDPDGLPRDVRSLTIGVIGLGNIGRGVVQRWQGFEPEVIGHDPYVDDELIKQLGAQPADFAMTLKKADILTLHVRLSEETKHLIDAEALSMMKESAMVVNTARGGLIDTDALVSALENREVHSAALDVFAEEPLPENHPLLHLDNVLLTPHTAGSTRDAVANGSKIVISDLRSILAGENPTHHLN